MSTVSLFIHLSVELYLKKFRLVMPLLESSYLFESQNLYFSRDDVCTEIEARVNCMLIVEDAGIYRRARWLSNN